MLAATILREPHCKNKLTSHCCKLRVDVKRIQVTAESVKSSLVAEHNQSMKKKTRGNREEEKSEREREREIDR